MDTSEHRDAHCAREIVGATGYHGSTRRHLQAGFDNVIPLREIVARFVVVNFRCDRDNHFSYRADADRSRCDRKQSVGRLFVPGSGKVPTYSFILDVELLVIGERREFE